jgi:magnesium chelatase family protein
VISVAIAAARRGLRGVIVPAVNAVEAAQVDGLAVIGVATIQDVVGFLRGTWRPPALGPSETGSEPATSADLSEVRGQDEARRALEVAAAGGHNLLMVGSPGAGKTMLARRLPTILPDLTPEEALEATQLHSVAGLLAGRGLLRERPFRAPHHSVSTAGSPGRGLDRPSAG